MKDESKQGPIHPSSLILHPSRRPDGVADASDPPKVRALVRIQVGILTVLGVWRRHATLRRSKFRFDSWRGHCSTLEPDGEAAGCNPAEVGSIPTGVSYFASANPSCLWWYGPSKAMVGFNPP